MRKYPVTYKGNTYEVRWEEGVCGDRIAIYEIIEGRIFKRFKTYECIYSVLEEEVKKFMLPSEDYDYYIKEIKMLFYLYECENERKERENLRKQEEEKNEAAKMKALEEWDGVIC